jgi:hypothetical protein
MRNLTCLCLLASALAAQAPVVTALSPARNARGASTATNVAVTFAAPVNAATLTPATFRVVGKLSGVVPGTRTPDAAGTTVVFAPSRPYFAGERVDVYLSNGVQSAGGAAMTGGHAWTFFVAAAAGSGTLTNVGTISFRNPGEGLIRTYGFYAGDIDRDGSPDMTAANEVSQDVRLKKNDGCGGFSAPTITALPPSTEPSPNEGADLNGDGWTDFVTGHQNGQSVGVFLNDGAGNYLPPTLYPAFGQVHGMAVLDADADGDIDVCAPNFSNIALFLNNGSGGLAAATVFNGGGSGEWCLAVGDANNDGKQDLFCGNYSSNTVAVLHGNGTGGFTLASTKACGANPWAIDVGDFDGDGNVDVAVALNGAGNVGILKGNGNGTLQNVVNYGVGSSPVWLDVGDLDGDGDLDVSSASFGAASGTVWRNNGTGTFTTPTTLPTPIAASSVVYVDYDRDGDLDVIVTDELSDTASVFRQDGPSPAGVQAPSCDAALRVNSFAARAGFGGRPPHQLPGGQSVFVNVSGAPSVPFILAAGVPVEPGAAIPGGLLNLALSPFPLFLVDGFSGDPAGLLDLKGETLLGFPIPVGALTGFTITLQPVVFAPTAPSGIALGNPESAVFL